MAGKVDYSALDGLPTAVPKPSRRERTKAPAKRKALAPVNPERKAERLERDFGVQADACRKLPCVGCGAEPTKDAPSDPHHDPSRAAGGTDADTVPVCRACHQRAHTLGSRRFWAEIGMDPEDVKMAVQAWIASGLPPSRFSVR